MAYQGETDTPKGRAKQTLIGYVDYLSQGNCGEDQIAELCQMVDDIVEAAAQRAVIVVKADATRQADIDEDPPLTTFDQAGADQMYSFALAARESANRLYDGAALLSRLPDNTSISLKVVEALADLNGAISRYSSGLPQRHSESGQ